jgi:hypothetical protein
VEDDCGLALRISTDLPVDPVSIAHVEHPAMVGVDFGI